MKSRFFFLLRLYLLSILKWNCWCLLPHNAFSHIWCADESFAYSGPPQSIFVVNSIFTLVGLVAGSIVNVIFSHFSTLRDPYCVFVDTFFILTKRKCIQDHCSPLAVTLNTQTHARRLFFSFFPPHQWPKAKNLRRRKKETNNGWKKGPFKDIGPYT